MTIEHYVQVCKKWEGGLSRDRNDSAAANPCPTPFKGVTGYHTNKGVTYAVWCSVFGKDNDARFFAMSDADWFRVFKPLYWDGVKGDSFTSINIAAMVTAFAWGSGAKQAGTTLQKAIKALGHEIEIDGVIGKQTISLANSIEPVVLFDKLIELRKAFFMKIGVGKNAKFLKGWLNRLADYNKQFRPQ